MLLLSLLLQPEPGAGTSKDDLVSLVAQHFAEQVGCAEHVGQAYCKKQG